MDNGSQITSVFFGGREDDFFPESEINIIEEFKLFSNSPCLACGSNIFSKRDIHNFSIRCSEDELLAHLCQFLKAEVGPVVGCGYWGYHGDEDEVPLCTGCTDQLLRLVELKEKIAELERELELSSSEFMQMCQQSEYKLEESGIYARDWKYSKIRRIFKTETGGDDPTENGRICEAPKPARKQKKTGQRKSVRSKCISAMAKWSPVVSISCEDRIAAEKSQVKSKSKNTLLNVNLRKKSKRIQARSIKATKRSKIAVETAPKRRPKRNIEKYKDRDDDYVPPSELDNIIITDIKSNSSFEKAKSSKRKPKERIKVERDPVTSNLKFLDIAFTHNGNDMYSCGICGKEVKVIRQVGKSVEIKFRYTILRHHALQFHSDTFKCPHCDYKSSNSNTLNKHISCVHNGMKQNRKPHVCRICGKPCESAPRYRRHLWTHYNEEDKRGAIARGEKMPPNYRPKYQCDECGKHYKSPSELNTHTLSVHTDKDKISYELCPICGKSVATFRMKAHTTRLHPSETFTCHHCDKKLPTREALRDHRYNEHEAPPHKCEVCGRRFRHKVNWLSHTNLHKGERPYPCPHCPMRFPAKINIRKHIRRFHQEGSAPRLRGLPKALQVDSELLHSNGNIKDLSSKAKLPPDAK